MSGTKLPIIGIPAWKVSDNGIGCTIPYLAYISNFGIPRIIMPEEDIVEDLDLLIIPGGPDVDSLRYKAIPGYYNSRSDPMKEYFDTRILPGYIEAGVPVFGVCRGLQSICVLMGATLVQNMSHETSIENRGDLVHEIEITDLVIRNIIKSKVRVNSMHHQCVSSHNLPECLEPIGIYKGRNPCIEVIRHRELPVYGVQYHPEELIHDPLGDYIVELLISKSKNYA
uniref:Putative peptidase n=1 Tax=viral metagenome TaxID=1070528 RepID=A0A6M3LP46_9ZZZZ